MVIEEALSGRLMCCNDLSVICQGENCAAWQWVWKQVNVNDGGTSVIKNVKTDYGYCGKAGHPIYTVDEVKLLEENNGTD